MKIEVLSKKIICSNPDSLHNYFAWPTVARLQNGKLAMVASGFRLEHRCPFGKCIISYSEDEGQTWTLPAPVIDTPLDDRDGGITPFGEKDVIVVSANNEVNLQRQDIPFPKHPEYRPYKDAYLDQVEAKGGWKKYLGATFRISHDCGVTFGELKHTPIFCPHGPAALPDGTLLYVGRKFTADDSFRQNENHISCYKMDRDGKYEFLSEIENVSEDLVSCEPHAIVLDSGKIVVHLRVHGEGTYTIYQCESLDGGKTFTKPHQILGDLGGSPAHLFWQNGTLVSVYGYRAAPYGVRAMFSKDEGETWDTDHILVDDGISDDIGYPASVVLKDGSILTIYYAWPDAGSSAVIWQVNWRYSW